VGVRFLKLILIVLVAVVAVLGGLFIGVAAAVVGIAFFVLRRWRARRGSGRALSQPRADATKAHPTRVRDLDVIDVTATEIPADRSTNES
jgi:hypothetical protein